MGALFLVSDWTTFSYLEIIRADAHIYGLHVTGNVLCSLSCTYENGWDSTSNSYARMGTLAARIKGRADRSGSKAWRQVCNQNGFDQ